MRKTFTLNLLLLMGLNLLIKPLYIFGIDIKVQNVVGASDYGLFFSIFNFSMLFQIILELGLNNLVRRDIAENKQLTQRYFSHLMGLKLLLLPVYIGLSLLFALVVGYGKIQFDILCYALIIQIGLSFILFVRAILAGLGKYKWDSLLSIMDKLILILLCGYLLYIHQGTGFTIYTFLYCYLAAIGLTLLPGFGIILLVLPRFRIGFHYPHLRFFVRRAFPYALITFLMIMYGRMDSVYLERLLPDGDFQAGIYAAGFRLLDAYLMFALLFSNLVLPMMTSIRQDIEAKLYFFRFTFNLIMVPTIIFGLGGWFFRAEITELLYHHTEAEWSRTVGLLLVTSIPLGLGIITGSGILSSGKLRRLNILYTLNIAINIILNLILIPQFKSEGAAISALSVNTITAIVQYYLIYQAFEEKVKWTNLGVIGLFLIFNVLIILSIETILPALTWSIRFLLFSGLSLFIARIMGLLPFSIIKQISSYRKTV